MFSVLYIIIGIHLIYNIISSKAKFSHVNFWI